MLPKEDLVLSKILVRHNAKNLTAEFPEKTVPYCFCETSSKATWFERSADRKASSRRVRASARTLRPRQELHTELCKLYLYEKDPKQMFYQYRLFRIIRLTLTTLETVTFG